MRRSLRILRLQSAEVRRYVAFGDVMKEVLFVRQVRRFMWPDVGMRCMSVFEDDEGAVQFAVIPITKSNLKHIDVGHHVFRELTGRRYIGCLLYTSPSPRD